MFSAAFQPEKDILIEGRWSVAVKLLHRMADAIAL
jgi:hypothetical protein